MSPRPRPTGRHRLAALGGISVALALVAGAGLQAGTATAAPHRADRQRYIVTTTSFAATSAMFTQMSSASTRTTKVFRRVFPGFGAELTDADVAKLRRNPDVTSVVPDARVHLAATTTTTTRPPAGAWGLDRIDQRSRKLDGEYSYDTDGDGVLAIVLDTGIVDKGDLRGRVLTDGFDYVDNDKDPTDCNGHGTHVSGTLAGTKYGVAKKADILPLRTLDCDGTGYTSDTVQALDDVAYSADNLRPAVVNLSLSGDPNSQVDAAVNAVVAAGIPVVVAAGNAEPGEAARSACTVSPARVPNAITVGATERNDKRAAFSYYGPCVDVFAPGVDIESDWYQGSPATEFESGTSMAAPHVAGAVARFLSAHPTASPAAINRSLTASATAASVTVTAGSPNLVLFARFSVPPSAARSVSAAVSSTSLALTLKWRPPASSGGSAVKSYELRRSGTDAKGRKFTPVQVSAKTRSYRFTGLKAATRYGMSVTPVNTALRGPAKAVRATTLGKPGTARVGAPTSGSTSDAATSITARWRPPSSGGAPARYQVSYRRSGTDTYVGITVKATKRSVKITKLRRNAKYVVIVRAGNAAGWGKNSARSKTATAR